MNYANQTTSTRQRLTTALLSISVTAGLCGSIIFGMAGGLDTQGDAAQSMAQQHAAVVAQQ